jgi:hypothetical protein
LSPVSSNRVRGGGSSRGWVDLHYSGDCTGGSACGTGDCLAGKMHGTATDTSIATYTATDTDTDTRAVHEITGRVQPGAMPGKPPACLQRELSVAHRDGDVYIVTFPKTGTTLLQLICHLLRCDIAADASAADIEGLVGFRDIHDVVPHTSSAWFTDQVRQPIYI